MIFVIFFVILLLLFIFFLRRFILLFLLLGGLLFLWLLLLLLFLLRRGDLLKMFFLEFSLHLGVEEVIRSQLFIFVTSEIRFNGHLFFESEFGEPVDGGLLLRGDLDVIGWNLGSSSLSGSSCGSPMHSGVILQQLHECFRVLID